MSYLERSLALTLGTSARLGLLVLVLHEWPHHVVALVTVVLDDGELRQDAGGSSHHAPCPDQLVEVELAERPKVFYQRQLGDTNVNFLKRKKALLSKYQSLLPK